MSKKSLIYGVGINDSPYNISKVIDGKMVRCPYYNKWRHMIERCYSIKYQENNPTYKGCTVCDEWKVFTAFRLWMKSQDWHDKDLDKDILTQGNKEYSPVNCIFVDPKVNRLLNLNRSIRGKYPLGVCFDKSKGKLMAQCKRNGKMVYLGLYDTADAAHQAYKRFKYRLIHDIAKRQIEPLKSALFNYLIPRK